MKTPFRRLQSIMTPLRVFEAAARHGSFTRAAEELGLSQPSVSRHIATLEDDLGAVLFRRNHNRIELTKSGSLLAEATNWGLSRILDAVEMVARPAAPAELVLACTVTFAHGWLLPRFSDLLRSSGNLRIGLKVASWLQDVDPDEIDLLIGWKPHGHTDWPRMPLFPEAVYPVCSPAFSSGIDAEMVPQWLIDQRLLQFETPGQDGFSWPQWFAHFGVRYVPPATGYSYSNYQFALQAAMDGEGIALGWHHLVYEHLVAGRLVRVGPVYSQPGSMTCIEFRPRRLSSEQVEPVLEWFRAQAQHMPPVSNKATP